MMKPGGIRPMKKVGAYNDNIRIDSMQSEERSRNFILKVN